MSDYERRILIVEDDAFMGSLMVDALATKGFTARLESGAVAAKRQLGAFDPDIVLVDIDLGEGPNGIEFIRMVAKTRPEVAAILLSKHADSSSAGLAGMAIPDGVGYLRKGLVHDTNALIDAIDAVTRGQAEKLRHDKQSKGDLDLLTKAQREILHMMALGMSNSEIAKQRNVSVSNVEQRITEIFRAFGIMPNSAVVPRVEAIRRYIVVCGVPENHTTP